MAKRKLLLRAEMDALPIQEQNWTVLRIGKCQVMHACGHDGIVASALVLARILAEEERFSSADAVSFEPAENR